MTESNGFDLDVHVNDDDVHIEVSGFGDVRNALAALVKVFTDMDYVAELWATLVEGDWETDNDDGWDDED